MRNRLSPSTKSTAWLAVAYILIGLVLAGPTAQAAEAFLKAFPSTQPIYLDGQQVQMTAYNIGGNNYVKLRDIGQAVDFNVYWDDTIRAVQIDSDAPYTGEAPAQVSAEAVSVVSYKGLSLKVGARSGLIISPSGPTYTAASSDPKVVSIEKVSGSWVAVAKSPGTATVTVTDNAGKTGRLTLTVSDTAPSADQTSGEPTVPATELDKVRQEIIRLVNEVRRKNGVSELTVNDSLMAAAQERAETLRTYHETKEECEAALAHGYPYGVGVNITAFTGVATGDAAQKAVNNWVESSGHFQTMTNPDCDTIGVGFFEDRYKAVCYLYVGNPKAHNPYE